MCYAGVAVTSNERSACDKIPDIGYRTYCLALYSDDPQICGSLDSEFHINRCLKDNKEVQRLRKTPHPEVPGRMFDPFSPIIIPVINNTTIRYW
jgi:hypothetical protein